MNTDKIYEIFSMSRELEYDIDGISIPYKYEFNDLLDRLKSLVQFPTNDQIESMAKSHGDLYVNQREKELGYLSFCEGFKAAMNIIKENG